MPIAIIVGVVLAAMLQIQLAGSSHEGESLYCELVFIDQTTNTAKQWNLTVQGATIVRRWGRIGAKERSRSKNLASNESALKVARAMIRRKLRKGYTLVRKEGIL